MAEVGWTSRDEQGRVVQHTTSVSITDGAPDKPVVVLLHGFKGNLHHMDTPGSSPGFNYNYSAPFPPLRDLGPKPRPGIGIYSVEPDPTKEVVGWKPFLEQAGFATANYAQIDPEGSLARPALELAAVVTYLRQNPPTHTKKLAFLAHSRGGLLVRKFLKDNLSSQLLAGQITKVITLGSAHSGTELANLALLFQTAIDRVIPSLRQQPSCAILAWQLGVIRDIVKSPAYRELRVGSPFLAELAANETPFPGAQYYAFAGTSPLFTRIRVWMYTPDSAIPRWTWPRGTYYRHRIFVTEMPFISPLFNTLPLSPELSGGAGDILAATQRAYFPFPAGRYTFPLNHAELLWDPTTDATLKNAVRQRLLETAAPPRQLRVSVSPEPTPLNRQIQLTVQTVDAQTNAPVASTVHLDNYTTSGAASSEEFPANSPRSVTLRTKTEINDVLFPSGYVRAPNYPRTDIDFGF
jgi:pimeloyl-ACP methyl ester carboxylesterase